MSERRRVHRPAAPPIRRLLLPIHAHSLVEILTAAAAHGVPFSPGLKMYRDIKPITEDELRSSCGRSGGQDGKNLFPDEKTPK
jgi:hypothetical protein